MDSQLDLFVKWIGPRKRRQGHSGVSQCNILSVTLSPFPSAFHRLGLLWIFGYSAFSLWPSTNKYKLRNLYWGLSYDYLHHFLFPDPSCTRCWISTSHCIQRVIYEVLAVWREVTERDFYQQQLSAPSTVKVSWTTGQAMKDNSVFIFMVFFV